MTTLIIIGVAVYFYIGGMIFVDMMSEAFLSNRALIGAFIFSILWLPFLIWAGINTFCKTTDKWYNKLGKKIFGEVNYGHKRLFK